MNRAGHQFLARAALAQDEHRGGGVGRVCDLLVDGEHPDVRPTRPGRADRVMRRRSRIGPTEMRQRPRHHRFDFGDIERLADVVERTGTDGLNRRLEGAKPADQQHVAVRVLDLERAQQVETPTRCLVAGALWAAVGPASG